jgi:hypothetical protein
MRMKTKWLFFIFNFNMVFVSVALTFALGKLAIIFGLVLFANDTLI